MKGATVVDNVMGLVLIVIVVAIVAIPLVINATAGVSGTAGTLLGYTPIFLAIVVIFLVIGMIRT